MANSDEVFISDTRNPWEDFGIDFAVDKYNEPQDCFNNIKYNDFPFLKNRCHFSENLVKCKICNAILLTEAVRLHYENRHHRYPELNGSECFLPYKDASWIHDSCKVSAKRERPVSNRRVKISCKRTRRNVQNPARSSIALDAIIETDSLSSAPDDICKSTSNTGSEEEAERSREPVLLKLAKSDCHIDRIAEQKSVSLRGDGVSKLSLMDRSVWSVVSQATSHLSRPEKQQTTKFVAECTNKVINSVPAAVPPNNAKADSHSRVQSIFNSAVTNPQTPTAPVPDDTISNPTASVENVKTGRPNIHPPTNVAHGSDSSTTAKCSQGKDVGRSVRGTRVALHSRGKTCSTRRAQNPVDSVIEGAGGNPSPNTDDRDVEIDPYFGTFGSPVPGISEKHMKVDDESSQLRNGFYKWHGSTSASSIYASSKSPDFRFCTEQGKHRKNLPSRECQLPVPLTGDESIAPSELLTNEAVWNAMSGRDTSSFPSSICRVPNNLRTLDSLSGGRINMIDSLHNKRLVHRANSAVVRSYQTQLMDASGTIMGNHSNSCFVGGTTMATKQRLNNPDLRDWMREARRRHQALRQERVSGSHSPSAFSNTVIDLTEDLNNPSGEVNSGNFSETRNNAVDFFPVQAATASVLPYYDPSGLYNPPFAVVRRPTDPIVDGTDAQTQPTIRTICERLRHRAGNYCDPTAAAIHSSDTTYRFDDGVTLDQTGLPVDHGVPRFIGLVSGRQAQTIAAAAGAVPLGGGKPLATVGSGSRQSRLRTAASQQSQQQNYASVPLHFSASSAGNSLRVGHHHWATRAHPYESHISTSSSADVGVGNLPGSGAALEGYLSVAVQHQHQHHHTPGVFDMSASHQQLMDSGRPLAHSDASSLRSQNVSVFVGTLPSLAYSRGCVMDGQTGYTVPNAHQPILSGRLSRSALYQTSGHVVQEQQGRVVVVDDIREKSITGRSRKAARSSLRTSNPVFPSSNFSSLLNSSLQQPTTSSQNPAMAGTSSFYAPSMRRSNPLVNSRAASVAAQGLAQTGPAVADRYLSNEEGAAAFGVTSGPQHVFQSPCSLFPGQVPVGESPPLNAPILVPSVHVNVSHAAADNYSPISMDSFLDSLDCASHEVEEPVDDAYQSLAAASATSRPAHFAASGCSSSSSSAMDLSDVSVTLANPTNRYLVIRPGLTKQKSQHQLQQGNPGVARTLTPTNVSSFRKPASSSRDV